MERPAPRIIAVANQKGGVGKTTTAVNTAASLAVSGHRVLLIDLDPQGNATSGVGEEQPRRERTSYALLAGDTGLDAVTTATRWERLDLVPSSPDLAAADLELSGSDGRELLLRAALGGLDSAYDFVFIDCPPSLGVLTVNGLAAAGEVLVPVQAEYYALEGLAQLLDTIERVTVGVNPELRILGIVVTMVDTRTRLSKEVLAEIRTHLGDHMLSTVVPRNVRLSEAPSHGLPICHYDASCLGCAAYANVAREIVQRSARRGRA